jgi:hypothetical protein
MDEDKGREVALPAVEVRYVGMGQLRIYLVSDEELTIIESVSPTGTLLNLAIALLALGIGSILTLLLSGPSQSIYRFTVAVVVISVSVIVGSVLLILWGRSRKRTPDIVERIRARGLPMAGPKVVPQAEIDPEAGQ